MSKYDGGPAFPCEVQPDRIEAGAHQVGPATHLQYGMTLRDYFASMAMQGLLSGNPIYYGREWSSVAADAYYLADSMLEEREK